MLHREGISDIYNNYKSSTGTSDIKHSETETNANKNDELSTLTEFIEKVRQSDAEITNLNEEQEKLIQELSGNQRSFSKTEKDNLLEALQRRYEAASNEQTYLKNNTPRKSSHKDLGSLSMELCEQAYGNYQNRINNKSDKLNQAVNKLTTINSLLQKLRDQKDNNVIELNGLSDKENEILKSLHIDQRSFSVNEAKNLVSSLERLYLTINQVDIPACQRELDHNMKLQNEVIHLCSRILRTIEELYRSFRVKER